MAGDNTEKPGKLAEGASVLLGVGACGVSLALGTAIGDHPAPPSHAAPQGEQPDDLRELLEGRGITFPDNESLKALDADLRRRYGGAERDRSWEKRASVPPAEIIGKKQR